MFRTDVPIGWFVGSENLTVIVSPLEYTALFPLGSSIINPVINGPDFEPNDPVRGGDCDRDGLDVPARFNRFALDFTVSVRLPTVGGVAPVEFLIVITSVLVLVH